MNSTRRPFPFCIPEVSEEYVGENGGIPGFNSSVGYNFQITPYLFGLTWRELVALYRRPCNWQMVIDPHISVIASIGGAFASAQIGSLSWQSEGEADGLTELSLNCQRWPIRYRGSDPEYTEIQASDSSLVGDSQARAGIFFKIWDIDIFNGFTNQGQLIPEVFDNGLPRCVKSNGLYYPLFLLDAEMQISGDCLREDEESERNYRSEDQNWAINSCVDTYARAIHEIDPDDPSGWNASYLPCRLYIPADGASIDVQFRVPASYKLTQEAEGSGGAVSISDVTDAEATFQPTSYHSYNGLWDTDTGDQIIEPYPPIPS